MSIESILQEYDIDIDDIRWYLSVQMAQKLLEFKENIFELTQFIWGKKLESELYNMEESYLVDLREDLKNNYIDESVVREIFGQVVKEKRKRRDMRNTFT